MKHQLSWSGGWPQRRGGPCKVDLAKALESLPPHYLEVVLLRDFEELTIAEMAERLNEPPGAIKARCTGPVSWCASI